MRSDDGGISDEVNSKVSNEDDSRGAIDNDFSYKYLENRDYYYEENKENGGHYGKGTFSKPHHVNRYLLL